MRKPVTPANVFILEIGIAAAIAMVGAMAVLLTMVPPADRQSAPIIMDAAERFDGLSRPAEIIRASTRAGIISETEATQTSGAPQPPRFIVSLSSHSEAAHFLRTFRENRGAARAQFADWTKANPTFRGFYLEGITTSGEAILTYRLAGDPRPAGELEVALTRQLNASGDVRHITAVAGRRAAR